MDAPGRLEADVAVVGGGPAGATIATLLARRGWSVVLLEKDRHPRFHIGESLLPMNLPILERLGVLEQVRAIGVHKRGADFPSAPGRYNTFAFARGLGARFDHAFQVRRDEFDALLFAHARDAGVDAREGVAVRGATRGPDGRWRLQADVLGGALAVDARYLVDASGRDTFLGGLLKLKRRSRRHRSAAIFAHFDGVERRPGEDAGNISIYRFGHGWVWMIPLRGDTMSIGAVCSPDHLKQRRVPPERFLLDIVAAIPEAQARMAGARATGATRVTGNYSYACGRMAGPGWLLVGDAYAFVDPIFSSGVYLAMHSAEQGAAMVDAALREPRREAALQRAMARRVDRGLGVFSWFIHRFTSPVMAQLFRNPRNLLGVEQALISMLSGDVFDSRPVLRRLHLFRLIYRTGCALNPAPMLGWLRARRRMLAAPAEAAGHGTRDPA